VRAAAAAFCLLLGPAAAMAEAPPVDVGLVLAVDVSGSVTEERYRLQMDGIAAAFEDRAVAAAILSGPRRSLAITLVQWSDKPQVSVPWTRIASVADAAAFAGRVRAAPRAAAQFTCMARMMRFVADKVLPQMPIPADRTVVDVSGDGHDNCNPPVPVDRIRDELVAGGATINGLPILEGDEATTLAPWYREHVIGGVGGFLVPANGFADFSRAIRQKFVAEISRVGREDGEFSEAGMRYRILPFVLAAALLGGPALADGPAKSAKERLSDKASDEQRVDNCKVPPDRRGPKPRPDCSPAGETAAR
jgi:hypothetical protein